MFITNSIVIFGSGGGMSVNHPPLQVSESALQIAMCNKNRFLHQIFMESLNLL